MARAPVMSDEHLADLKGRAERRFAVIDDLPRETRELVHEYGWAPIKALMELGVKKPAMLRHYILTIRGERT